MDCRNIAKERSEKKDTEMKSWVMMLGQNCRPFEETNKFRKAEI